MNNCRCCNGGPVINDGSGLCGACSAAVERFLHTRQRNLSPDFLAKVAEWRKWNA